MFFLLFTVVSAVVMFVCTKNIIWSAMGLIIGAIGWLTMPTLAWGFTGAIYLLVVIPATFSINITANSDGEGLGTSITVALVGLLFTCVVPFFTSSTMLNATQYKALIGEVKTSQFNADVSPIDVTKVRIVNQKMAKSLVEKRLGQYPSIGSRTTVGTMNIQNVNGDIYVKDFEGNVKTLSFDNELMWVGPLNHSGLRRWFANGTTQGFVMTSSTNVQETYLVTALCTDSTGHECQPLALRYLISGAYFSDNIERHLYNNGYASTPLTSYSFEIEDGTGRPYIVATQYEHQVGSFGGNNATGVVVVDVQTGEITPYDIEDTPAWIDRIQPAKFVSDQLDDWGQYVKGWFNASWGAGDSVIVTTPGMSLVQGSDGESYWYTDMQSSGNDDGSVGYVLTNTRTKETRYYKLERGGANITAAKAALESAKGVAEAGYTSTQPILYNVGGVETYFGVLLGANGKPAMYGFVDLETATVVGVEVSSKGPQAALRRYQLALTKNPTLSNVADLMNLVEIVVRVTGVTKVNDNYYLMFEGNNAQEFWAESIEHPELKWTKVGDNISVTYQRSEDPSRQQSSIMLKTFDNLNIGITKNSHK